MIDAHATAVLTAIRATGATAYDVDEVPQLVPLPYVMVMFDMGRPYSYRLHGRASDRVWRVGTMFVGSTAGEARAVADDTYAALEGNRVTVTNRVCTPMHVESSLLILRDTDDPDLYSGSTWWSFASDPAA